ncbi:recombinase family protein [soil metagenome]
MPTLAYSYIRFSTNSQGFGDSLRRQVEGTERLCAEKGYVLDTLLSLRDLGVSGFRGKNAKKGALSTFLKAVRNGDILPGSALIVEDIDRLSRQEPLESFSLIHDIIMAGITLFTLTDRQVYTRESLRTNPSQLFILIGKIIRAHEESQTKSFRVRAWRDPRLKEARERKVPIAQRLPGWIRLGPNGFELISEKTSALRRAIDMALDGKGPFAIARSFNREQRPVISGRSNSRGWHYSTVKFYLRSRLLLGEYQPTRTSEDGKRVPLGDPIQGYYPAVIDETTFYQLQRALDVRAKGKRKGREGKNVANLFGLLLANGFDGTTCYLAQKRKENINLVSCAMQQGLTPSVSFPYPVLERGFLQWVAEVSLEPKKPTFCRLDELRGRLAEVNGQIADVQREIDKRSATSFSRLVGVLAGLEDQETELTTEIEAVRREQESGHVTTGDIARLAADFRTMKDEDRYGVRVRLRQAISSVVEQIELFPRAGVSALIRHAVVVVWFRDGVYRLFELRSERGRPPVSIAHGVNDLVWQTDDADHLRSLVGSYVTARALLPYAEIASDPFANTVLAELGDSKPLGRPKPRKPAEGRAA